ncbi:MAG: hypothetical protein RDU76_02000 [Candidatus Edwardsbacteria bacterium]|nr:hypothetical protein [Candidatus Edwardsbacteria bacterium]
MERVYFVKHKNRDILVVDISGIRNVEESIATLQNGTRLVKTQALGSVLLLTNVSGTHYDTSGADAIKTYSKENTPFIKASAVVGVSGIKRLIFNTIIKITGRKIMPFDDAEAAKDWLAGQQ